MTVPQFFVLMTNPRLMQVFINTPFHPSTGTLVVKIDSPTRCSVADLKQLIRDKEPRLPERFNIRGMTGSYLDDSRYLMDYNIQEAQTFMVNIPFRTVRTKDPSPTKIV